MIMKRLDDASSRESFLVQFYNKVTNDTFLFLSFNPQMNKINLLELFSFL